jgi:hypothetical protein
MLTRRVPRERTQSPEHEDDAEQKGQAQWDGGVR